MSVPYVWVRKREPSVRRGDRSGRQPTTQAPWALDGVELTRREAEVLSQMAVGQTNSEIGQQLGVSSRTVEKHLQHIYAKLGIRTRTAALVRALALSDAPDRARRDITR